MDKVLILDFGSQFTQLIARRVREIGVYCEILPCSAKEDKITTFCPKAIILSGSPESVNNFNSPQIPKSVFELKVPILGICYGQQALCAYFKGGVKSGVHREFGNTGIKVLKESPLFKDCWLEGREYQVWMSHSDSIALLPSNFMVVAASSGAPFAVIADEENKIYGLQFHPEVVHTPDGAKLLGNFLLNISGCRQDWRIDSFLSDTISRLQSDLSDQKVICALSGGVDSTVAACLIQKAIGERLVCVFIDTGLLRKGEPQRIVQNFRNNFNFNLLHIDARKEFFAALKGVKDPEEKRKAIGKTFIEVFEKVTKDIEGVKYLAQGTIYPDVIESISTASGSSVTIKSHHNVGGLPKRMNLKLVEPLRELFKDEVRKLALALNIPAALINQHPFPGPGLAVRIIGKVTPKKCKILQEADAIYIEELKKAGLYDEIWQALVVLLPTRSVGVMGDERTYQYVCALRAVTSTDGMTADFCPLPHSLLGIIANRIVNEVKEINRVVYDITSKPPATIEWE